MKDEFIGTIRNNNSVQYFIKSWTKIFCYKKLIYFLRENSDIYETIQRKTNYDKNDTNFSPFSNYENRERKNLKNVRLFTNILDTKLFNVKM